MPLFSTPACRAAGIEVACHNDLSPCNAVFRDRLPIALIDFDAAAPGSREFDLGYAAWLWLDIGCQDYSVQEQRRRWHPFLDAYGAGYHPGYAPQVYRAPRAYGRAYAARPYGYGYGYRYRRPNYGAAAAAGVGAAIIGGLAAQQYYAPQPYYACDPYYGC